MTLLGFKTILHKKCRSGKNSEGPAENSWTYVQQNENKFPKIYSSGMEQCDFKILKSTLTDGNTWNSSINLLYQVNNSGSCEPLVFPLECLSF